MKSIVGLGNPGKEYENTPHNAGFAVADELADRYGCSLRKSLRFNARMGKATEGSDRLMLVQPQTYMNESGKAVASVLRYYKAAIEDMVVVLDDADLDLGRIRVRSSGGAGGHRGLRSIIDSIGTENFARVRIGIGRDDNGAALVSHVLSRFSAEEGKVMKDAVGRAADAVSCVLRSGVDEAMNGFNGAITDD